MKNKNRKEEEDKLVKLVTADTICEYLPSCMAKGLDNDRCYQNPTGCHNYQYFKRYGPNWQEIGIG